MVKQPKLRKKSLGNPLYWFTKAGADTYFENTEKVPYKEAKKLFNDHVKSLAEDEAANKSKGVGRWGFGGSLPRMNKENTFSPDFINPQELLRTMRRLSVQPRQDSEKLEMKIEKPSPRSS